MGSDTIYRAGCEHVFACLRSYRGIHWHVWPWFGSRRYQVFKGGFQVFCSSSSIYIYGHLSLFRLPWVYCGFIWLFRLLHRPLEHRWFLDHPVDHDLPAAVQYLLLLREGDSLCKVSKIHWFLLGLLHGDQSFLLDEAFPFVCLLREADSIDRYRCQRVQRDGLHHYHLFRSILLHYQQDLNRQSGRWVYFEDHRSWRFLGLCHFYLLARSYGRFRLRPIWSWV